MNEFTPKQIEGVQQVLSHASDFIATKVSPDYHLELGVQVAIYNDGHALALGVDVLEDDGLGDSLLWRLPLADWHGPLDTAYDHSIEREHEEMLTKVWDELITPWLGAHGIPERRNHFGSDNVIEFAQPDWTVP